jgi:hypothetical protein
LGNTKKEFQIVKSILHNSQHNAATTNVTTSDKITRNKGKGKKEDKNGDKDQEKSNTFTCCGEEVKYSNKLFKVTEIKISYQTNKTIEKILAYENRSEVDKVNRGGVYQLTCQDCGKKYIGQIGSSFRNRYNEHLQSFKYQNSNATFAKPLRDTGH